MNFTFTLDLEDHRVDTSRPERYTAITRTLLSFLERHQIHATIFAVGTIAENTAGLIREITRQGHELAFHSYRHTQLHLQSPQRFRRETESGKKLLEDISGQAVAGFRAPVFSLTPDSIWALDILQELGFEYSSSILPARGALNGFPGAPRHPFYWPNGILEIPVPLARFGPFQFPYLGGFYFRYLPFLLIRSYLLQISSDDHPWLYCHPYDFDPDESFSRIQGASWAVSWLLWRNRRNTFHKLEQLISMLPQGRPFTPFIEKIHSGQFNTCPSLEHLP